MSRYSRLSLHPLTGGVRYDVDSAKREANFATNVQNIRFRDGTLYKRPGTKTFISGTGLGADTALAGTITNLFEYKRETGTSSIIAITGGAAIANRRIYSSSGSAFTDITPALWIDGDSTTAGAAGKELGNLVTQPWDATVAPRVTGGQQIDVLCMSYGGNEGVIPNVGVVSWDGTTLASLSQFPGSAKTLTTFAGRLFGGHIFDITAGRYRGNTLAWSNEGDCAAYTATNFVELVETPDLIERLMTMRGRMIIYKTSSIFLAEETGLPVPPIQIALYSRNVGCVAPYSIAATDDRHFFMGADNIYMFDGSTITPIGGPIHKQLRNINSAAYRQVFSAIDVNNSEYWLFVPEGAATVPTAAWVFNYAEGTWSRWVFPQAVTSSIRGTTAGGPTWASMASETPQRVWSEMGMTWDQLEIASQPTVYLGMADKTVDECTYKVVNDSGVVINCQLDTKDIDFASELGSTGTPIAPLDQKTLTRISLRCTRGNSYIRVGVSVDGTNFTSATVPGTNLTYQLVPTYGGVVHFDIWKTAPRFRIRLHTMEANEQFPEVAEIILHYHTRGES